MGVLHPGFSIVASLAHTEYFFKKTKRSCKHMRENGVDSPYLFLYRAFSFVANILIPLTAISAYLRKAESPSRNNL